MAHAAVLIPGIMGSELRLGDEVVWPGPLSSMVLPYNKLDKLMSFDLVATDVIRRFSISEQYQKLINDLGRCGFREDDKPKTLYVFPYDWRKDNALAARRLADVLDEAVMQNSATEISLIGHSMGGLTPDNND